MSIKRIILLLLTFLALWSCAPVSALAEEERSLYIGDIITLEVTARGLSAEDVAERFHAFEIVDIKAEGDGFLLSLRTLVPGEQRIILGDKEIVIDVRSTLDDIIRDDVFEADEFVIRPGFIFHWRLLFYAVAGVFALSGGFVLWKALNKRAGKKLSSIQLFLRRSGRLSADDDNYFVDLTFFFKEYLEALYGRRIIGKTSDEIVSELEGMHPLETVLPEMREWLSECDRLKFTGVTAPAEDKKAHCGRLLVLAQKIDAEKDGAA